MERIAKAGAGFRSITENIDTTTPAGRMMMQMVGAFADDAVSAVMRSSAARTQELPGLLGVRCYA
jgi:DNA invertase Pin-like site-specific DNA recombinase